MCQQCVQYGLDSEKTTNLMACLKSMHGARESHAPAAPAALGGSDRCAQELKVEVQTDAVGEPHGFVSVSI